MDRFTGIFAFAVCWILRFCQCKETNENSGIMARTFDKMGDMMWHLSHGMSSAMGLGHLDGDWGHGHWNKTSSNSSCQTHDGYDAIKVPLYVITPAIIIGVLILIKLIGLIVVGIPAITAPLFSGIKNLFKHSDNNMESGYGWGYPSPSPQYGVPAPSPSYGALPSLSRQTSILNAIDDANNQYNGEQEYNNPYQYQPQLPSSNYANSPNYNYNSLPYAYSGSVSYNNPASQAVAADRGSSSSYSSYDDSQQMSPSYNNNPISPSYSAVNTNEALQNYMQVVTQNKQQNASSKG